LILALRMAVGHGSPTTICTIGRPPADASGRDPWRVVNRRIALPHYPRRTKRPARP
jgi:hypothetical protein